MSGTVPPRVPVHKTRKETLPSHLDELVFQVLGKIKPTFKETVRSMFQNPNPDSFYNRG
ncbi:hypothetical protein [Methanosarcina acetivorans]|uniref:hypothetical protein n=1 Tax=Methanosarcina acetivorans TaxID=2214 RepID=UPI000A4E9CAA|nr:hypothetical protein [Methanosarcina acetivorans]